MSEAQSSSSYQYENFFNQKEAKKDGNKGGYPFYCNVWSCKVCHTNEKRLSPEEIRNIREKRRSNNNFYPRPKRCDGNCNFCYNKINGQYGY